MAAKLYRWSTDPAGKPASHTISEAEHNSNVKATGFTPTPAPTSPPAGTYDPGLDASQRANQRGLLDLQQDTDTANSRANTKYLAGLEQSNTTSGWSLADLLSGRNRTAADLATALGRENESYGTNTATIKRNYTNLGSAQTAKASSGAFVDTGSIAAGASARAENQGRDQTALDTAHTAAVQDNSTAASRNEEDYTTNTGRVNQQTAWTNAGLSADYQYGVDDRSTALARALREGTAFSQDTAAAKMYQATSSGLYTPPTPPSNEFSDAQGPYRLIVSHGLRYKERPNGKREPAGVAH